MQSDVHDAMQSLTHTLQSLNALADYLQRHPGRCCSARRENSNESAIVSSASHAVAHHDVRRTGRAERLHVAARALPYPRDDGQCRQRRCCVTSRMADRHPGRARHGAGGRQPVRRAKRPRPVDILEQERWAAPLGDELRDGLSTRVASRLGTIDIHHVAHAADAPVYRVTVNIQRIESWPASRAARCDVECEFRGRAAGADLPQRHSGRRIGGHDALVDAHRHALDMLALDIAAVIRAEATRAAPRAGCRTGTLDNNPG